MSPSRALALAALAVLASWPALADAPPAEAYRGSVGMRVYAGPPVFAGPRLRHRPVRSRYGVAWGGGPVYGQEPAYFPGTGSGSPTGLTGGPVSISLYRDAYIGRGLIYNVPPQADLIAAQPVISVRY